MKIKFRAWSRYGNRYLDEQDLLIDGYGYYYEEDLNRDIVPSSTRDDFTIEQWTGLTDKNGDDIYEGDILEVAVHQELTFREKYIVSYDHETASFFMYLMNNKGDRLIQSFGDQDITAHKHCEVIGNIHHECLFDTRII